jgi:ADP-dependent NAD(P)H-hydrate dehydratase / NAD(P)H-hydrate epimerase
VKKQPYLDPGRSIFQNNTSAKGSMMDEILTVAQAYEADRLAASAGVNSYALMQKAGAALAHPVMALKDGRPVQVFCGPGANGGDGYVAASVLRKAGIAAEVFCLGDPEQLKGDAKKAFKDWGGPIAKARPTVVRADGIIIDALFGAGLSRPISGDAAALVGAMNASGGTIISADLPSGISGDLGQPAGPHIKADATVTFFRKKCAHVLEPARRYCGQITVADIGIPDAVLETIQPQARENGPTCWPGLPPSIDVLAHKHTRGHVLVRCGASLQTGAARLAARAALRTGAGLVSLLASEAAALVCAAHETEVMIIEREKGDALAPILQQKRVNAVVIGPAGGVNAAMREDVQAIRSALMPMVLDADGISAFADMPASLFALLDDTCVLTPHEGEFARLFPDLADRGQSKVERVKKAAERAGCTILLKGPDTVIAAPNGRVIINTNAPPWLATAGSGDVLAGIIGALLAQQSPGFEAAACGVWLHGAAGKACGRGLIAGDLEKALPAVLRGLCRETTQRIP